MHLSYLVNVMRLKLLVVFVLTVFKSRMFVSYEMINRLSIVCFYDHAEIQNFQVPYIDT